MSPFEEFKRLHFERWRQFSREADPETVYIFECAYLQNHISEMLRAHEMTEEAIIRYMKALIQTVEPLKPKLIYLSQPDVRETIQRVAEERRSPEPKQWKDWIDLGCRICRRLSLWERHARQWIRSCNSVYSSAQGTGIPGDGKTGH